MTVNSVKGYAVTDTIVESIVSQEDIKNALEEVRVAGESAESSAHGSGVQVLTPEYKVDYVAYRDFYPSEARYFESGSERLADLARRELGRRLPQSSVDKLIKDRRPRFDKFSDIHFILVTDNIGSGNQAITFLYSMISGVKARRVNPGQIKFTILTWGATVTAIEAISDEYAKLRRSTSPYRDYKFEFVYLNYIRSLHELEDNSFILSYVESLRSTRPKLKEHQILGYKSSATLTVFEGMACPNTISGVFFNARVCDEPIFDKKHVYSGFFNDIIQFQSENIKNIPTFRDPQLNSFARLGLSGVRRIARESRSPLWEMLVYAAAGVSPLVARAMIHATNAAIIAAGDNLLDNQWIDPSGHITERGTKALTEYARQNRGRLSPAKFTRRKDFEINETEYYPKSIGGVS